MIKIEGKNILITGGAGFIGSHLAEYISEKNANNIYIVDNLYSGNISNLNNDKMKYKHDKIDPSDLSEFVNYLKNKNIDVIFDLATVPVNKSIESPLVALSMIYNLSLSVCEAIRLGLVGTGVHCSSSEVYGMAEYFPINENHPFNVVTPYAGAKASAAMLFESYRRTFNIDMVIARPFNNYGPRQSINGVIPKIIRSLIKGAQPVVFGDGEQTRDFIFVADTVRALVMIYENDLTRGNSYNIGTGIEININRIISDICKILDIKPSIKYLESRKGEVLRYVSDCTKIYNEVGFKYEISWLKGIQKTIEWYLKNDQI